MGRRIKQRLGVVIKSFRWNRECIAFLSQRGFEHDRRQLPLRYIPGGLQLSPPLNVLYLQEYQSLIGDPTQQLLKKCKNIMHFGGIFPQGYQNTADVNDTLLVYHRIICSKICTERDREDKWWRELYFELAGKVCGF